MFFSHFSLSCHLLFDIHSLQTILNSVTLNSVTLQLSFIGGIIIQKNEYVHPVAKNPQNNLSITLFYEHSKPWAHSSTMVSVVLYLIQEPLEDEVSAMIIPEGWLYEFQVL